MTAVEEVQAAIAKLEAEKAMPEPEAEETFGDGMDWGIWYARSRSVDAQLAILRDDLEVCLKNDWIVQRLVLMLARAINGTK